MNVLYKNFHNLLVFTKSDITFDLQER